MRYIILHFLKIINNKSKYPFYHYFITVFCIIITIIAIKIHNINKTNQENFKNFTIEYTSEFKNQTTQNNKNNILLSSLNSENVISSKKGRVYYFITCMPKTLKKENIIIYNNETLAKNAGKTLSKSCKK